MSTWMIRIALGVSGIILMAILLLVVNKTDKRKKGDLLTNSIGMKLVYIPPGTFSMGSPKDELNRLSDEDEHEVEITRGFYLGVYEVTQDEYQKVMGKNPSVFSANGKRKAELGGLDTNRFPVENVSYQLAVEFCDTLSKTAEEKQNKHVYRLPTEAEWEYSARGGASEKTTFHTGKSLSPEQANFDFKLRRTCAVGSYQPNGFGLYDMHGNVYEWCSDLYAEDYYSKSPKRDPKGHSEGYYTRVIRGGGKNSDGLRCRSAHRGDVAQEKRCDDLGFRVVLAASPNGVD